VPAEIGKSIVQAHCSNANGACIRRVRLTELEELCFAPATRPGLESANRAAQPRIIHEFVLDEEALRGSRKCSRIQSVISLPELLAIMQGGHGDIGVDLPNSLLHLPEKRLSPGPQTANNKGNSAWRVGSSPGVVDHRGPINGRRNLAIHAIIAKITDYANHHIPGMRCPS